MKPEKFSSFADLPSIDGIPTEPSDEQTPPRSVIQVAKLGKFGHPRYGKFNITQQTFESFQANFQEVSGGEVAIDVDHAPERGGPTEAYGWIRSLRQQGEELLADVEWTWRGAMLVADKAYRYISPTWSMTFTSDDGTKRGPTLLGAALTNRPFFERMRPCVLLSQSFAREEATFATENDGPAAPEPAPSDSRAAMDRDKLIQVFGLDAEATDEQILEASQAAQAAKVAADDKPNEPQIPEGHELVKTADLAKLTADAERGSGAADDLADMRFTTAFDKAVDEGRAAPAHKDNLRKFFDADQDAAIEHINALEKIVNTASQGSGSGGDAEIPDGYDEDSVKLDREVRAYMAEHKESDYTVALDAVIATKEVQAV